MTSVSIDISKEQETWFCCSDTTHEFEIRFGNFEKNKAGAARSGQGAVSSRSGQGAVLARSGQDKSESYENGVSASAYHSLVNSLTQDDSFVITNEHYENTNYIDKKDGRYSNIRGRQVIGSSDLSFIKKINIPVLRHDINLWGIALRLSEAKESTISRGQLDFETLDLIPETVRNIKRVSFTTIVSHSVRSNSGDLERNDIQIKIDCSEITMNKKGVVTHSHEVEMEVNLPQRNVSYFSILQPFISKIIIGLYGSSLQPLPYQILQKSNVEELLSIVQRSTEINLYSNEYQNPLSIYNTRGLVVNLKSKHIPLLQNYAMTNKLDGERKMIIIIPAFIESNSTGWILIMNSGGVQSSLLSDSLFILQHDIENIPFMILDVEYYDSVYHAFDVVFYQYATTKLTPTTKLSHEQRMRLVKILTTHVLPIQIQTKLFLYGSINENISYLLKHYPDPRQFFTQNDGIIFTPKLATYKQTHAESPSLKFKFSSKLSVDFKCILSRHQDPLFNTTYDLLSSRNTNQFLPFNPTQLQQQTSISSSTNIIECVGMYLWSTKPITDSNNRIITPSIDIIKWIRLRDRPDKENGNSEGVVKDVMDDIKNPLSILQLFSLEECSPANKMFLQTLDYLNQTYYYDLFFNELIKVSYQIVPQYVDHIMFTLFGISPENELSFKSLVKRTLKEPLRNDTALLDDITKTIVDVHVLPRIPYYMQTETENLQLFIHEYNLLFGQSNGMPSIFDVRQYGLLSDQPCIISRHIYAKQNSSLRTPLPNPPLDETIQPSQKFDKSILEYKDQSDHLLFPYQQFFIVPSSNYSVLKPWHVAQVKKIIQKWFPFPYQISQMVDATAHIGTDSIYFSSLFPKATIQSYEIQPDAFLALRTNIRTFHKESKITPHYGDITTWMPTQAIDIIYMDPPWGGHGYNKFEVMDLFLQKEGEERDGSKNCNHIIDRWMNTGLVSHIILKTPFNFNTTYLSRNYTVKQETVFDMRDVLKNKIEYHLLHITPKIALLRKPKSKLTLWSLPYYFSYDEIFFNTEAVLIVKPNCKNPLFLITTVLQQYMYTPISYDHPFIISIEKVREYAAEHDFVEKKTIQTATREEYVLFVHKKAQVRVEEHKDESLKEMRKYHNREKNAIIQKFAKNKSVLDLGIGFGGDLQKYMEANVSQLIGIDPSEYNLLECASRLKKTYGSMESRTTLLKATGQDWTIIKPYVSSKRVQVVSSFFSLTFLFQSRQILQEFLYTVNESLEEGGYFIGTMMSGEKTYKLLQDVKKGDSYSFRKKGESIVSLTKHYENTPSNEPSFGLQLDIQMPDNTIVGDQSEYLAFFTLLQAECQQMGLQLVYMYDFIPNDKLQAHEKEFSLLNIGFVFQKLPLHFSKQINPSLADETYQFINLFSSDQSLLRTGVAPNHSFVRSILYNTMQSYRIHSTQRDELVYAFRKELSLPDEITLEMIPAIMKSKELNIYIIDSHTRRPIRMEGYDVSRTNSIVVVAISTIAPDGKRHYVFEPLASNIKGMAKRIFQPLDSQIVSIHRAMMRGK